MPDFQLEKSLWQKNLPRVAGIDEAGRGPLAGPVVAAAVVLHPDWYSSLPLADSKKISASQRERLAGEIKQKSLAWSVRLSSPAEIDRLNILRATLLAMERAVSSLSILPDYALIDGNQSPDIPCPGETIIKGDNLSNSIAAASIIAKTTRDHLMHLAHKYWPQWNFTQHKGYPTAAHRQAILRHGTCPIHRNSFLKKIPVGLQNQSRETKSPASRSPQSSPADPRQSIGKMGESHAEIYLLSQGYRIHGRNVRLGKGELDIIAEKDEYLVFVEVKTRTNNLTHPSLSVTPAKQAQLRKLGELYLTEHDLWDKFQARFDVISIQISPHKTNLEHFINAC